MNANRIHLKQNDTGESVKALIVERSTQQPVTLTGASAVFSMYQVNDDSTTTQLVSAPCTVNETDSILTYAWATGNTSVAGVHLAYFTVTYQTGIVEKFPRAGYIEVEIEALP